MPFLQAIDSPSLALVGWISAPVVMASCATSDAPPFWNPNVGALTEFIQPDDRLLVGDFAGVGHDELLMLCS